MFNVLFFVKKVKGKITWYLFGGKKRAQKFAMQRALNQKHCFDFPAELNGWKKIGKSPVYGNLSTGSIFDPFVFSYENTFFMVASERKTGNLILLRSEDGKKWLLYDTILEGVSNTWEKVVNRACILCVNGVWHLWYTGQNGKSSCIGHLASNDFTQFTRSQNNNAVLIPTLEAEGLSVMNPCVLWNEQRGLFQMWYAAGESYEPDVIFYAESKDGNIWKKREKPVLTKLESHEWEKYKVGGCDVKLLEDGSYIMYYIGYQNLDVARICFATSKDGINWERSAENICISPSENSWDAHACYKPSVIIDGYKTYMWYNGRKDNCEYIGLATKG